MTSALRTIAHTASRHCVKRARSSVLLPGHSAKGRITPFSPDLPQRGTPDPHYTAQSSPATYASQGQKTRISQGCGQKENLSKISKDSGLRETPPFIMSRWQHNHVCSEWTNLPIVGAIGTYK